MLHRGHAAEDRGRSPARRLVKLVGGDHLSDALAQPPLNIVFLGLDNHGNRSPEREDGFGGRQNKVAFSGEPTARVDVKALTGVDGESVSAEFSTGE